MVKLLKISRVKKSFKEKIVLKDINLEVKGSEIIGLVGKSGCGKSTLLKILVGYYKPDGGDIFLDNNRISEDLMGLRSMVGYTTQENSFYEKLSVIENMKYYSNLYGIPRKISEQRITTLLDQVGLLEHKKTQGENLSGGMKRRLDFAISLLHDPHILILDEPTTGLDPLLSDQFWRIVKEVVAQKNKIVIMSSHILSEMEKNCTKVAVINDGRIIKILDKANMKGLEEKFRKLVQ
jgi:ABC-type multidrug transport system ATPase subunit